MRNRLIFLGFILVVVTLPAAPLRTGRAPSPLTLTGDAGGMVSGGAWRSGSMQGRVHVLFYVDPDHRDWNEHVAEALGRLRNRPKYFGSVAIINMAASWMPGWLLDRLLARKQKQYPRTVYVSDRDRVLVRSWGLSDDGYDIVLFDADGTVLFHGRGALSEAALADLLRGVQEAVERLMEGDSTDP